MLSLQPPERLNDMTQMAAGLSGAIQLGCFIRHWRLIILCALAVALLAAGYAFLRSPYYIATAVILVGNRSDQSDVITARGDVETFRIKLLQLAAQSARLNAELTGDEQITFPPDLLKLESDSTVGAMLSSERLLFSARRQSLEESLERMRQERVLAEQRVEALERQIAPAAVQLEAINQDTRNVQSLVEQKLATTSRLLDLARTGAVIASRKFELESELLKVRQGVEQTEQRIAEVVNQRRTEALHEQQGVLNDTREYRAKLSTSANVASRQSLNQRIDAGMLANEIDVITSDAVSMAVVRDLSLHLNDSFVENFRSRSDPLAEDGIGAATEILQTNLLARAVAPGSKIEISYRSADPYQAALIANTIAKTYLGGHAGPEPRSKEGGGEPREIGNGRDRLVRAAKPPSEAAGLALLTVLCFGTLLGSMLGIGIVLFIEARTLLRRTGSGHVVSVPGFDRLEGNGLMTREKGANRLKAAFG
jgi:hypothetical protein